MNSTWLVQPSTIDWCESNYVVLPTVAEFWNCVSLIPWILLACLGLATDLRLRLPSSISVAHFLSLWIALGSVAFHGLLTRFSQSQDELPMLYLGLWSVRLVEDLLRAKWHVPTWVLVFGCVMITIPYLLSTEYAHFLIPYFIGTTGSILLLLKHIVMNSKAAHRKIGFTGVGSMIAATAAWAVEMHTCRPWLPLHSLWHIGVGVALYHFFLYVTIETTSCTFEYQLGWLAVACKSSSQKQK